MSYRFDEKNVIYADLDPKEGVVLNLTTKNYYRLNETGQIIWQGLSADRSPKDIAIRLTEEFDVALETAERDVEDVVASLIREGLISAAPESDVSHAENVTKARRSKKYADQA